MCSRPATARPIPLAAPLTPTDTVQIEGSPSLPQKRRLAPLPNIAVEQSAENRAVVSLRLPHADRLRCLRIECESTRFRAAHDAALREIRTHHGVHQPKVCCLAWRHSQILLLQLRHLPDLVDFQARILSLATIASALRSSVHAETRLHRQFPCLRRLGSGRRLTFRMDQE